MKTKLRDYQEKILTEIIEKFKTRSKGLLSACCRTGKTIISLFLVRHYIKQGKRVAVCTYNKKEIRSQWISSILKSKIIPANSFQVVCAARDIADYIEAGIPAVSNGNVYNKKPVTLFIPQSISEDNNMGKFDYIIIDEAHEHLDVDKKLSKVQQLKTIIKKYSKKTTKILGLSGTGFELLKKGSFFEDSPQTFTVIYDMPEALNQGIITDCDISVEYFNFTLKNEFYKSNEINKKGVDYLKTNINARGKRLLKSAPLKATKLKEVLDKAHGKTLVIVPQKMEEHITNLINLLKGPDSAVSKTSRLSADEQRKNEAQFKNSPITNYMVVIRMCGVGWDYPELETVIDLTFTKSPKALIQWMSRVLTNHDIKTKKIPKYIYCADQSKSEFEARYYIHVALYLTTKEGILSYKDVDDFRDIEVYMKAEKMLSGKELGESEATIEIDSINNIFDLKKQYDYDRLTMGKKVVPIFKGRLSDVFGYNMLDICFTPLGKFIKKNPGLSIGDTFKFLKNVNRDPKKQFKAIRACLRYLHKNHRDLWDKAYGKNLNDVLFNVDLVRSIYA